MWFGYPIINSPALSLAAQKSAPLHQSQVFRGHIVRDFTVLRQFADGKPTSQQHLDHPQSNRVRQRL